MDGFELTRKLREQNSSLPIWGLTANAQANEREKGLNLSLIHISMAFATPNEVITQVPSSVDAPRKPDIDSSLLPAPFHLPSPTPDEWHYAVVLR